MKSTFNSLIIIGVSIKSKIIFIGLILLSTLFLNNSFAFDISNLNKIEDPSNKFLIKMGLKSLYFDNELGKAVFIRKNRPENNSFGKEIIIAEVDNTVKYVGDTYFFYNFNIKEIKEFIHDYENENLNKKSSTVFSKFYMKDFLLMRNANAECIGVKSKTSSAWAFMKKMNSYLNGEQLAKLIGCAGEDPKIENENPSHFQAKDFANYLKETWSQLKEIIVNIPNMNIPDNMKSQLMCDAFMLGVMVPEDMVLSASVSAAPLAVVQTLNATNRLLKTVKYINEAQALAKYQKRFEEIFKTQSMMANNLRKGSEQIRAELKTVKSAEKIERLNYELKDWTEAELTMQKDLLETAKKLNKTEVVKSLEGQIHILEHNLQSMH